MIAIMTVMGSIGNAEDASTIVVMTVAHSISIIISISITIVIIISFFSTFQMWR